MIKINTKQKGNNVIDFLTYSSFTYDDDLTTDYEINNSISILFLSLRFHCCKPEYIYRRINKLKQYRLSVLLVYVDTKTYSKVLLELQNSIFNLTILLGFTNEECARYLRAFDINQNRPINVIRRKDDNIVTFFESFPKINKTDVASILQNYDSIKDFLNTFEKDVKNIKGIGKVKIGFLKEYLEKPFNE